MSGLFYSNVPLAEENKCPSHLDHNRLARQVNLRLTRSGPDCIWRIFYYADSIFTNMRSTATPGIPIGINPAEDEWWKTYMNIEYPIAQTGEGNWPLALAGTPAGANVMNPLNAFIFGRKTAENKKLEKMGPWAEGNNFDGVVDSSRAVLSNKQYWESAFRQRGAIAINKAYDSSAGPFEGWDKSPFDNIHDPVPSDYLPTDNDPVYISSSLFLAGRSSERYFKEYASNSIYMRYPPTIFSGVYWHYGEPMPAPNGILKRKNAAKDLLSWGLWAYAYYFKGSEAQRSLFCARRPWKAKAIEYEATGQYLGQQIPFLRRRDISGPLTICRAGFDFYKYYTRQNVFAPCVGLPVYSSRSAVWENEVGQKRIADDISYDRFDDIGNPKIKQYRVSYALAVPYFDRKSGVASKDFCPSRGWSGKSGNVENYDWQVFKSGGPVYGKTIRVRKGYWMNENVANDKLLLRCSYDNSDDGNTVGDAHFSFKHLIGSDPRKGYRACIAGYYLQTNAVENPDMKFKLRIWKVSPEAKHPYTDPKLQKIVHETIISKKYSYAVNRNFDKKWNSAGQHEARAYVYNKMHYFKEGLQQKISDGSFRFEIVPVIKDGEATTPTPYLSKAKRDELRGDGLISFGNPFSSIVEKKFMFGHKPKDDNPYEYELHEDGEWYSGGGGTVTAPIRGGMGGGGSHTTVYGAQWFEPSRVATDLEIDDELETGDLVRVKQTYSTSRLVDGLVPIGRESKYVHNAEVMFVRKKQVFEFWNDFQGTKISENGSPIPNTKHYRYYFYRRLDGTQMFLKPNPPTGGIHYMPPPDMGNVKVYESLGLSPYEEHIPSSIPQSDDSPIQIDYKYLNTKEIIIEKMEKPTELFRVDLDLAVLMKTKPTFQDAYALLRVATDIQNKRNTDSNIMFGDAKGVGRVGHHFYEANRIFNSYYKYGSAMNIYGSSAVPALRQYISANPIYESMRKFVGSFMRFAGRRELVNYEIENGTGVLYFKRYAAGLPKIARATILRNMEPPVEPCGWMVDSAGTSTLGEFGAHYTAGETDLAYSKFNPIKAHQTYRVFLPSDSEQKIIYDGREYSTGQTFEGVAGKEHVEHQTERSVENAKFGAFQEEGIISRLGDNESRYSDLVKWSDKMKCEHDSINYNAYWTMYEFHVKDEWGSIKIHWEGKISPEDENGELEFEDWDSLPHRWGWQIYNETQDKELFSGSYLDKVVLAPGRRISPEKGAFWFSKHAVEVSTSLFDDGDKIQVKMVSINGEDKTPVNGSGYQTLCADSLRVYASGGSNFAETNEWTMFMTSSHYHWAYSNIYKPSIYSDIMCFLNNRCHHRSLEYERNLGIEFDMIRTELCRVTPGARTTPGPRLHVFLSKSSNNFNYVFNTNDPYQGNLGLYAEHSIPPYDYYRSCPPTTPSPYKVKSVKVVTKYVDHMTSSINPGAYKGQNNYWTNVDGRRQYVGSGEPAEIVRVELDKPLRGTGRLPKNDRGFWRVIWGQKDGLLEKEPYRTDENAVVEYLRHKKGGYSCKRNMIGDYAASSNVVEGVGTKPFGACYPRFYFLKLIPKVPKGSLLNTEPYAQMDFYFRAMSGAFINPYSTPIKWGLYRQTSVLNWQFGELASRSSEEDPTLYNYVDPRNVESRGGI